jgi:hypothetical protein
MQRISGNGLGGTHCAHSVVLPVTVPAEGFIHILQPVANVSMKSESRHFTVLKAVLQA